MGRKTVFDEARQLAGDERESFVRDRCANDPAMAADVLDLLKHFDDAGDFLIAAPPGLPVPATPACEGPGATLGRYKLLELIGEGAFGSVFRADQQEPVRRTVAIKVIKPGMDTRQVIARFEQERQALALMDHPGIAKVLDAGMTEAGRPYFVMELVRGEPITCYCDNHRIDVRERLRIFMQVCHAVQHAHQKGIIHRDLKPSNILVALGDGRHEPRIIDFGIAKATGPRLTEMTVVTEQRVLIGTPEYMSPEQAEMGGVDIDTRTDIYSLGVLLYELLTGATPFDPQRLRSASWAELQRIIREDEPPRPSTRLSAMAQTLADIAIKRDAQPARLRGLIQGDLDWMVMKCLDKDRSRRYETASELAQDIARHLAGEPVLAAPPSTIYRVRKFVRRNRVPVMAAVLTLFVGLLGLAATTVALMVARGQRDRAIAAEGRALKLGRQAEDAAADALKARDAEAGQRRAAEDEARRAAVARTFIDWSLGFADPEHPERKLLPMQANLSLAAETIGTTFEGRLKDEIEARVTLGQLFLRLDQTVKAETQMRQAIDRMRKTEDHDPFTMYEAHAALYSCAAASNYRDFIFTDRRLAADSAVAYLARVNKNLGAATAEFVDALIWDTRSPEPRRVHVAGVALLAAAGVATMTRAQGAALSTALLVPCPESTPAELAKECGPVLMKWLERAEQLKIDDYLLLELRHTVLKLYVNAADCDTTEPIAWEQLRATAALLPSGAWQRLRYEACAARTIADAGNTAEARPILVDVGRRARQSPHLNTLAAWTITRHVIDVATAGPTYDPTLVDEALGTIDAELFQCAKPVLINGDYPRGTLLQLANLLTDRSVPDPDTRCVLGATLQRAIPIFAFIMPDGPYLLQRFSEFVRTQDGPQRSVYALTLLDLGRCASEQGDWPRARLAYERAVECFSAPETRDERLAARASFLAGSCRVVLGERAVGLTVMRNALSKLNGRLVDPLRLSLDGELYVRLLECGDRHEAQTLLQAILAELRISLPPDSEAASPLLRTAVLQPDLDGPTLEAIRGLAHDLARQNARNDLYINPWRGLAGPLYGDLLRTELTAMVRQNNAAAASTLAADTLRTALEATSPSARAMLAGQSGVVSVRGLDPQVYALADQCAMEVGPVTLDWYQQQVDSLVALRCGRLNEALDLATRSDAEWIQKTGRGLPDSAALRACACARLGRFDEARAYLCDAQTWAHDRAYATPLTSEAEDLIGGH